MRFGQPDVERHEAGLGSEAEQREQECGGGGERCERGVAHAVEGELPASALQHSKAEQDADGGEQKLQGGHFFLDMAKRPLAAVSTEYLVPSTGKMQ